MDSISQLHDFFEISLKSGQFEIAPPGADALSYGDGILIVKMAGLSSPP